MEYFEKGKFILNTFNLGKKKLNFVIHILFINTFYIKDKVRVLKIRILSENKYHLPKYYLELS